MSWAVDLSCKPALMQQTFLNIAHTLRRQYVSPRMSELYPVRYSPTLDPMSVLVNRLQFRSPKLCPPHHMAITQQRPGPGHVAVTLTVTLTLTLTLAVTISPTAIYVIPDRLQSGCLCYQT